MKNLLPLIVLALCLALGAGGGFAAKMLLAPKPTATEEGGHAAAVDGDADGATEKADHAAKGGHGEAPTATFVKFSRQFVVPTNPASRRSLVILDLNIEVAPEVSQQAYALEPKLRDACLSALLRLSAEGRLAQIMTSAEEAETLKAALLEAVKVVLGEGAIDVLITDIATQTM